MKAKEEKEQYDEDSKHEAGAFNGNRIRHY